MISLRCLPISGTSFNEESDQLGEYSYRSECHDAVQSVISELIEKLVSSSNINSDKAQELSLNPPKELIETGSNESLVFHESFDGWEVCEENLIADDNTGKN